MAGKLYVVSWGSGWSDEKDTVSTHCGVHGLYRDRASAERGLEECRDEFIDEIVNNPDFDEEDREAATQDLEVYGSVKEDYFEIDYTSWDKRNEIYIHLEEKEIKD